jgi:predicted neuraminidase
MQTYQVVLICGLFAGTLTRQPVQVVTWYGGSYESSDDEALFLARRDAGETWVKSQAIPNTQPQGEQPAVAQRKDGSLLAFLRTAPRLLQTESFDRGITWSTAKPTDFKNPDEAISLCSLKDGTLVLAWNNQERGRSPLHIARSTDGGETWSNRVMLESNPGEYSYPSLFQSSDQDWLFRFERPD